MVDSFAWQADCVVKLTRPRPSWLRRLLPFGGGGGPSGGAGGGAATAAAIEGVIAEVEAERAAGGLAPWEQGEVVGFDELVRDYYYYY